MQLHNMTLSSRDRMQSIIFIKNAENLTIYGNEGQSTSASSSSSGKLESDSRPKDQVSSHSTGNASIDRTPGENLGPFLL